MTTRSTSASAASALRSGASPGNRAAVALERTISEPVARQRRGDRIRQAERQEVGLWIGTQHAERQHDDASERLRQCPRAVAVRSRARPQLLGHDLRGGVPLRGSLGQRAADHPSTAATVGEPLSAGGCSDIVACSTSPTVRPPKAGRPASISNRIAPAANTITAGVDRLAHDLLGRHVSRRTHHEPCLREVGVGADRFLRVRAARGRSRAASRRVASGTRSTA